MFKKFVAILGLVSVLLFGGTASVRADEAAGSYKMDGFVVDQNGVPIPDVLVKGTCVVAYTVMGQRQNVAVNWQGTTGTDGQYVVTVPIAAHAGFFVSMNCQTYSAILQQPPCNTYSWKSKGTGSSALAPSQNPPVLVNLTNTVMNNGM